MIVSLDICRVRPIYQPIWDWYGPITDMSVLVYMFSDTRRYEHFSYRPYNAENDACGDLEMVIAQQSALRLHCLQYS